MAIAMLCAYTLLKYATLFCNFQFYSNFQFSQMTGWYSESILNLISGFASIHVKISFGKLGVYFNDKSIMGQILLIRPITSYLNDIDFKINILIQYCF